MSHSCYSSAGSFYGSCHTGDHLKITPIDSYGNHHRRPLKNHGGSKISHSRRSNASQIGIHFLPHGGAHISHQSAGSHHKRSHTTHHGNFPEVHHGDHFKALSVHGGSGGKGIIISKNTHGSAHGRSHQVLFTVNEKETMQHLNNRLATYLDKVRSLEQQNAQFESIIRDWYERNQPSILPDSSCFFRIIRELQGQISSTSVENAKIILQIDNARLAADDYQNKYEMERQLICSVEADVKGLRILLEELNREICHLRTQVQNFEEELQQMKRSHEEEVSSLKAQLGARVNVEMDAAPSVDLNRTLSEIREQYENLMERNLREVETIFRQRTEELNRDVAFGSEELQSVQTEVIDLRRNLQTLEIELQSQLSMKSALENTLAETEATFGAQLAQLQSLINDVESQLSQVRSDLEHQNHEYRTLMDQKTHLEMEIATYKRLLEGHDIQYVFNMSSNP
ncbi:keratin, type I cytoskeletal 19-like [Pyxicephalus adspersus]|uniref:keratin, type I cytoskeletal 19-like n=1 Tax=Pyxicephalus adspersus TaxID=30357 RepID=UPI003B58DC06